MTEKCILCFLRRRGGDGAGKLEWIKYRVNEAASLQPPDRKNRGGRGQTRTDEEDLVSRWTAGIIDREKLRTPRVPRTASPNRNRSRAVSFFSKVGIVDIERKRSLSV
jgi:hypothetical protein